MWSLTSTTPASSSTIRLLQILLALIFLYSRPASADVDTPIIIKGSKFFYQSNGTQFFIKGIVYTPSDNQDDSVTGIFQAQDILADNNNACSRDIPYFLNLETNTISVSGLSAGNTHAQCMSLFAQNDIYVTVDLSSGSEQIGNNPASYTTDVYNSFTTIIDEMSQYPNVLAFFVATEIFYSDHFNSTANLAYFRAAARDLRQYMRDQNYRAIPIGYSAADILTDRRIVADYVAYNDSSDSSADLFGQADYSWCGQSTFTISGYDQLVDQFKNYSPPFFFSQYGCNTPSPRTFGEVAAIYGPKMTDVLSGATVYQYFNSEANFGLINATDGEVSPNADYTNLLSAQSAAPTPSSISLAQYTPTNTPPTTPPSTNTQFSALPTLPPRPYSPLCSCMMATLNCTIADLNADAGTLSEIFATVCTATPDADTDAAGVCAGITANATTGTFGAYSMCSRAQQAAWALNAFAALPGGTCLTSSGVASVVTPQASNSSCQGLLGQAGGASGTGTLTSYPPTRLAAAATGTGSGSASATAAPASSSSLSTGAKAGIGVAAAIAALLLIAAIASLFLLRRRRRRRAEAVAAAAKTADANPWGKSELPVSEIRDKEARYGPHYADGTARAEMASEPVAPVELAAEDVRPREGMARPGGMGELGS